MGFFLMLSRRALYDQQSRGRIKLALVAVGLFAILTLLLYSLQQDPIEVGEAHYPHQSFYHKYSAASTQYDIVIVADNDKSTKNEDHWRSSLLYGTLSRDPFTGLYSVNWGRERVIKSKLNEGGRGMELSDLCNFGDRLYSFDDRTGMVMVIEDEIAYPVALLMDGDGRNEKGFKAEWCSVKDNLLYVGGMGKDWTDGEGNFINSYPLWVKTIDQAGVIQHHDWTHQYNSLRETAGAHTPGYILNEAAIWLPTEREWFFLPRRVSKEKYDAVKDEYRCSNVGVLADEFWRDLHLVSDVGPLNRTRGFSTAKFVPWRENEIVVLKTEEVETINTYILIYDIKARRVLLEETLIYSHMKFEGIEFI